MKKFAILIIVFKRPDKLETKIRQLLYFGYPLYIYVDFDNQNSPENKKVISIINDLKNRYKFSYHINKKNIGPGYAVPAAIDWAFKSEENLLILEDDCELGNHALQYFENAQNYINGDIKIVSGRSAWNEDSNSRPNGILTLTNYPLTNGWLVSKIAWKEISIYLNDGVNFYEIIKIFLKSPTKLIPLSFFYSACILNTRSNRKAWDCFVALKMISQNYFSVNPDLTLITTRGIDEVASNTFYENYVDCDAIALASIHPPGVNLDRDKNLIELNNLYIENVIYSMKCYHLFSPIKSWFKIFKYNLR